MEYSRDIHHIQQLYSNVEKESVDSTNRMVEMIDSCRDLAIATMSNLDNQGEQLKRIDGSLDKIHTDATRIDTNLDEMEKCCGCLRFRFRFRLRAPPSGKSPTPVESVRRNTHNTHQRSQITQNAQKVQSVQSVQSPHSSRSVRTVQDNINYISSSIRDLKSMALEMNAELVEHNNILDRITEKSEINSGNITSLTRRAEKLAN